MEMLFFQTATVLVVATWIVVGLAIDAISAEEKLQGIERRFDWKDKVGAFILVLVVEAIYIIGATILWGSIQ